MAQNTAAAIETEAPTSGQRRISAPDARADGRRREVVLSRDRIVFHRRVCGVAMRIGVDTRAFAGVQLRVSGWRDDGIVHEITLIHRDADLCVPLVEIADPRTAQCEWRLWARFLNAPALIERVEGVSEPADNRLGALTIQRVRPRRRGSAMVRRRPLRFPSRPPPLLECQFLNQKT